MSILLDQLCITASSLRSVLAGQKWEDPSKQKRMYKMAISTVRRIINVVSESNYIMKEGTQMEDILIGKFFADTERYSYQRICEKTFVVGGVSIPFRATLDVFDNETKTIIEIKYAVKKKPDLNDINNWINNVYCKLYDVQAQIQMMCCDDYQKMKFLICSKVAGDQSYWSEFWQKDENFLETHQDNILEYWEMLKDVNDKFFQDDQQTLLDIYQGDEERSKSIIGEKMESYAKEYLIKHEEKSALEKTIAQPLLEIEDEMERLKGLIVQELAVKNSHSAKIGRFSITQYPKRTMYKWSNIVKDRGIDKDIIASFTEEDKLQYITEYEAKHVVRISSKRDLFGDI